MKAENREQSRVLKKYICGIPVSANLINVRMAVRKNGKTIPKRDYVFELPQEANKEIIIKEHMTTKEEWLILYADMEPAGSSYINTSYTYDNHGRVVLMENSDKSQDVLESMAYGYDDNNQIISYRHINNMSEENTDETRSYAYDDHGSLVRSVKTDNTESGMQSETTYTYDSVGNRIGMQVDDTLTEYEYNGLNQLISMSCGNSQTEYAYDERGNQIQEETVITGETEDEESAAVLVF